MMDTEKKEEVELKAGFFKKVWQSITKIEKYPDMSAEGIGKAFGYMTKIVIILAIVLSLGMVYQTYQLIGQGVNYLENDFPQFSYEDGKLSVESEEPIIIENSEAGKIIIDTKNVEEQKINEYTELVKEEGNGIIILQDKVILKDGTKVNVEMQNIDYGNIVKRLTYYSNLLYLEDFEKGKDYNELKKTISIGILNFDYFKDINIDHTIWRMTEQKYKYKTLMEQELHFIELPKFLRSKIDTDRKLDQWLVFIDYSKKELIKMSEEKNNIIKEANQEYEYLTGDEELKRIAFLRRKYELDYNSGIAYAKRSGMEKGLEEGLEKGIKKGMEKGAKQEKIKIAKKMLKMKVELKQISEITGLKLEEIEKLK